MIASTRRLIAWRQVTAEVRKVGLPATLAGPLVIAAQVLHFSNRGSVQAVALTDLQCSATYTSFG